MMIRQFIPFILFAGFVVGCQENVSDIADPKAPQHELKIDGDVQFHGEVSWSASEDSLNTKIWIENTGTDTARVETGPCAFNVIANNKNGDLVWYNRPPSNSVCFDVLITYEIAPKETKQLNDQMHISGRTWYWDIPAGDWDFKIESRTKKRKINFI